jgi:hypothetical protein
LLQLMSFPFNPMVIYFKPVCKSLESWFNIYTSFKLFTILSNCSLFWRQCWYVPNITIFLHCFNFLNFSQSCLYSSSIF